MSNRMKIKPPKVKMSRTEAGKFYDRLCCAIAFVNTAGIYEMEAAVCRMRTAVREDELLHMPRLTKAMDDLDHVVRKQMEFLDKRCLNCRVNTAPYITTYEMDYITEGRIVRGMHQLVRKRCSYYMGDLDAKAGVIAANGGTKSKALLKECYIVTTWSRIITMSTDHWVKKWRSVAGKTAQISMGTLLANQARSAGNLCSAITDVIGDTPYDRERPMWKQYHAAEDEAASQLLALIEDDRFNEHVMDYMTRDWMDFYIGSAALECQQTGEVSERVMTEITAVDKDMRLPFLNMIRSLAKKVEKTDDRYDFVDYLGEHPYKAKETLLTKAMTLVTWETGKPSQKLDTKALMAAHPEICQQFMTETPGTRRFLVK